MKKLTVSIVIPNLNGEKLIEKNFPKVVEAWNNPKNSIKEVIIVDDGSWDGSVKFIKSTYPKVKLIKQKVNRGFSVTVNAGVRVAKGDLILLLNTDVLPDKDFLEFVIPHFANKKVFAVSVHEKGYGYCIGGFKDGYISLDLGPEVKSTHPSFYVSGGSGVFRRSIWVELGGMDEKLLSPFYWEDIDLCYRALKRGYENLWEPRGVVEHHHESTISKFPKSYVQRVRERNQLLMLWKNIGSKNLLRKHLLGMMKRLAKHPGYVRIIFMALMRFTQMLKSRRKELKEGRVSDESIFQFYS